MFERAILSDLRDRNPSQIEIEINWIEIWNDGRSRNHDEDSVSQSNQHQSALTMAPQPFGFLKPSCEFAFRRELHFGFSTNFEMSEIALYFFGFGILVRLLSAVTSWMLFVKSTPSVFRRQSNKLNQPQLKRPDMRTIRAFSIFALVMIFQSKFQPCGS